MISPDLCGIDIEGATLPWSGGYTYLDRTVPIFAAGGSGPAYYDYMVVDKDHLRANPPPARHIWSSVTTTGACFAQVPPAS